MLFVESSGEFGLYYIYKDESSLSQRKIKQIQKRKQKIYEPKDILSKQELYFLEKIMDFCGDIFFYEIVKGYDSGFFILRGKKNTGNRHCYDRRTKKGLGASVYKEKGIKILDKGYIAPDQLYTAILDFYSPTKNKTVVLQKRVINEGFKKESVAMQKLIKFKSMLDNFEDGLFDSKVYKKIEEGEITVEDINKTVETNDKVKAMKIFYG